MEVKALLSRQTVKLSVLTNGGFEFRGVCVAGYWDDNLHIVSGGPSLELRLGLHHDLDPEENFLFEHINQLTVILKWIISSYGGLNLIGEFENL